MGKLSDAIKRNDVHEVKKLLSTYSLFGGYENNPRKMEEERALQIAASLGSTEIMKELLDARVNVNFYDPNGNTVYDFTAFACAAIHDQTRAMRLLIDRGADINLANKKTSPLNLASYYGSTQAVKALIDCRVLVNQKDSAKYSPLYEACSRGHLDVAKILIDNGACVDAEASPRVTPLRIAIENEHIEIMKLLIAEKAKIYPGFLYIAITKQNKNALDLLLANGAKIDAIFDSSENTYLHFAAEYGFFHAVTELIKRGIAIDKVNTQGQTALWSALESQHNPDNRPKIISALIEAGAFVNHADNEKNTPLHRAIQIFDQNTNAIFIERSIEILLEHGANPNAKNNKGIAPKDLAPYTPKIKQLFQKYKDQPIAEPKKIPEPIKVEVAEPKVVPAAEKEKPIEQANPKEQDVSQLKEIQFPQQIDSKDLTLGEPLGEGGFGKVYKATYQYTSVAVKVFTASKENFDSVVVNFAQEIVILNKLNSPHIVHCWGASVEATRFSIVMEYMPNGTLFDYLQKNKSLGWAHKYKIALQITAGIAYLHKHNVVHGDLKSPNVLLNHNNEAKLADFGMSKIKTPGSEKTIIGNSLGFTLRWMAPELLQEGAKNDFQSDIYSYAIILWELGTHLLPYHAAETTPQLITSLSKGKKLDIDDKTPKSMGKLIAKCWQERDKRPSATEAMAQLDEEYKSLYL